MIQARNLPTLQPNLVKRPARKKGGRQEAPVGKQPFWLAGLSFFLSFCITYEQGEAGEAHNFLKNEAGLGQVGKSHPGHGFPVEVLRFDF